MRKTKRRRLDWTRQFYLFDLPNLPLVPFLGERTKRRGRGGRSHWQRLGWWGRARWPGDTIDATWECVRCQAACRQGGSELINSFDAPQASQAECEASVQGGGSHARKIAKAISCAPKLDTELEPKHRLHLHNQLETTNKHIHIYINSHSCPQHTTLRLIIYPK